MAATPAKPRRFFGLSAHSLTCNIDHLRQRRHHGAVLFTTVFAMSKLLSALKLIGTYLLALLAAFTWGLPPAGVAPWAVRASWLGAILLFLLLASLPRTRKLCLHLSGISLAAFFGGAMW